MRVQKRNPWLYSLGVVLAAMALWGTRAGADVTSDRPGSVVIWPKVIADGTRDTLITLTNTRNEQAYAHCEYVNGIGICRQSGAYCTLPSEDAVSAAPACPGGDADICDLNWQSDDFDVILTRQQPTIWRVSTGRIDDPLQAPDGACSIIPATNPPRQECPGFFLVGQVRPPVQPFRGQLRCIQTTMDGSAIAANGLKGEATIETLTFPGSLPGAQISKYNSINIRSISPPTDDPSILELNGVDPANTAYNVYNACPEAVEFTNYAVGTTDLVAESITPAACSVTGCPVTTEITILPCRADFENEIATHFQVDIRYTDEFESTLSVERDFNCWVNFTLQQLGFSNVSGSTFQRTRINPTGSGLCIEGDQDLINVPCSVDADCGAAGVCAPASGVLAIVEEFHDSDATTASPATQYARGTDAANAYSVDVNGDTFIGRLGHCRGALTTTCTSDAGCPAGKCRNTGAACSNTSGPACGAGDFCDQCMNDEIRFQPDVIVPLPPTP
jgi:hypothetical protein